MTHSARVLAFVLACGVCTVAAAPQHSPRSALSLAISTGARLLYPGSVALVTVAPTRSLTALEGSALGRPVRFWQSETTGKWQALVGIALDVPAGAHPITVAATGLEGDTASGKAMLRVTARTFETRRLKVEERFANPPPGESERIEHEARLLASLFADSWSSRLWRQAFVPPVPGAATSSFGRLTVLNGQPRGRHLGADFVAAVGVPVRAPNFGLVVLAEDLYYSGNTVILDHGGGLFSLFGHLSRVDVRAGTIAARGDTLGAAGATGRVTGPHLHWAVRLGEVSVDPQSLMSAVAQVDAPARRGSGNTSR